MSSISGLGFSGPINLLLAFVLVLVLIGLIAWAIRRFAKERSSSAARSRQPRLAVLDTVEVDARRQLVIIRRDNIEHLLMIGGGSDLVIETNIVRGSPANAGRDNAGRMTGALDGPRTSTVYEGASWPAPQPDAGVRLQRSYPIEEPAQWQASIQPEPRPDRPTPVAEPMAPPLRASPADRPTTHQADVDSPVMPARPEPPPTATVRHAAPPVNAAARLAARLDAPQRQAPSESQFAGALGRTPAPPIAAKPEEIGTPPPPATEAAEPSVPPEPRPKPAGPRFSFPNVKFDRSAPPRPASPQASAERPAPRSAPTGSAPERGQAKPRSKSLYDSLEQEMASLLGKPPGKS